MGEEASGSGAVSWRGHLSVGLKKNLYEVNPFNALHGKRGKTPCCLIQTTPQTPGQHPPPPTAAMLQEPQRARPLRGPEHTQQLWGALGGNSQDGCSRSRTMCSKSHRPELLPPGAGRVPGSPAASGCEGRQTDEAAPQLTPLVATDKSGAPSYTLVMA